MKRSPPPARKTPLKRTGALVPGKALKRVRWEPPRKPIAQESAKHRSERDERAVVVAQVRSRDRTCRAAHLVSERPCGGPLDVHETIQRSLWAAGYLDPTNCVLVCRQHHEWIDAHVERAHTLGLLRHSWERDAT